MKRGQSQYKSLRLTPSVLHVERLQVDGEQPECRTLPEELVLKIVAMIRYPYIFKARTLSKLWRSRFSPTSSIADEKEKCHAILFQKHVCKWSHRWGTFSPVSFGYMLGLKYDLAFRHGKNCLPSLSFLPPQMSAHVQELEGPLLCGGYTRQQKDMPCLSSDMILFVANILTRTWKQLPGLSTAEGKDIIVWKKLVRNRLLKTYKVIVLTFNLSAAHGCSVHIYDSKTDVWKKRDSVEPSDLATFCNPPAFLNGVLYIPNTRVDYMEAFHVEEETWEKIKLRPLVDSAASGLFVVRLAVCNGRLLRIELVGSFRDFHDGRVMEIDLVSRRVTMVVNYWQYRFNCPGTIAIKDVLLRPFSDGNTLFLGNLTKLGTYNLKEDQWKWFNFRRMDLARLGEMEETPESSAFCFEPGLNPFAEV